jgi:type IV pilus assembly protein PilQ
MRMKAGWAPGLAVACAALVSASLAPAADDVPEARVTLDVKDADIHDVVGALADVAGLQVVFDPGVVCTFTVSVREAPWLKTLQASLGACRLGYEAEGSVVRIATRETLTREAVERRRLAEEERRGRADRMALFRLSYARAREMAPLLKKYLSERGQVVYDERTNTLIILD